VNYALVGFRTIGIDISDDGFSEARELIKELRISKTCKVIQANCLKLPFEDSSAASVSDTLCFTHIKPKDQKKYKSELYRVLKPGGYVLMVSFSDKDKHFHGHKVSKKYTFRFDPTNPLMNGYSHYHGMFNFHFGKKEIKKAFGDSFEIIEMEEVAHPLYHHRFLWNIILRKPVEKNESKTT
ncbi:MAG: 2-heptaprenyl-1,4-naphthoquinone methyltransferase, partial [Microgenomates group bacterium Gr01-1014_93]